MAEKKDTFSREEVKKAVEDAVELKDFEIALAKALDTIEALETQLEEAKGNVTKLTADLDEMGETHIPKDEVAEQIEAAVKGFQKAKARVDELKGLGVSDEGIKIIAKMNEDVYDATVAEIKEAKASKKTEENADDDPDNKTDAEIKAILDSVEASQKGDLGALSVSGDETGEKKDFIDLALDG